jgi:hypothetical protein
VNRERQRKLAAVANIAGRVFAAEGWAWSYGARPDQKYLTPTGAEIALEIERLIANLRGDVSESTCGRLYVTKDPEDEHLTILLELGTFYTDEEQMADGEQL